MKEAYQAKFKQGAGGAEDLGGLCPGRPVHHRPDGAERLWRRAISARPAARATSIDFLQQFRANGGKLFDDDMKAQLASRCRRQDAAEHDRRQQGLDPRQQRARRGLALGGLPAGQGGDDLLLAADRPHGRATIRRATRRSTSSRSPRSPARSAMPWCPGNPEHATGYNKALSADSANPEAAYLFMQWATLAAGLAGPHACCPTRCAIPYRLSHFKSELYGALFPSAKDYLAQPQQLGQCRPARHDHARLAGLLPCSIDRMCTSVWAGTDPKAALETAAAEWDADDRPARRRLAEGVLRRVHEAARLLRRPHGREAGHGGEALRRACGRRTRSAGRLSGERHCGRTPARCLVATGERAFEDDRCSTRHHRRACSAAGAPRRLSSLSEWSDRHFKWLLVAPAVLLILALSVYPLLFSSGCPSSTTISRFRAMPSSA